MEDFAGYRQELKWNYPIRRRSTRDHPSSSSPSQLHINLHFTFQTTYVIYFLSQDPTQPPRIGSPGIDPPDIQNSININLQTLCRKQKARETLIEELQGWPVPDDHKLRDFVKFALMKSRQAVISMPPGHSVLYLYFTVVAKNKRVVYPRRRVIERVVQRSMEEYEASNYMVPAEDSSIESLDKMIVDSGTCSICLEEFFPANGGCEVVCMPCKHIFHEDCIKKWLGTSHYCPVCRFEMPAKTQMLKNS
ncbi:hypothetical protein BUALT_Bualt05G0150500 [Buddleja alternifolia]|uniref:RING-type E3 ubiquitin transferase n=1 Tax=Buddleja alternifolia TaxID=168488 RepID=A0AAV6XVF6_9LAMI|nr:hypothetical protein BUALT_Bualt05G0150500 [Buddleja alternifolia]